jgi:hypothetical protein
MDSPLEGDGFELPVPRAIGVWFRDFALAPDSVPERRTDRRENIVTAAGAMPGSPAFAGWSDLRLSAVDILGRAL